MTESRTRALMKFLELHLLFRLKPKRIIQIITFVLLNRHHHLIPRLLESLTRNCHPIKLLTQIVLFSVLENASWASIKGALVEWGYVLLRLGAY